MGTDKDALAELDARGAAKRNTHDKIDEASLHASLVESRLHAMRLCPELFRH